LNPVAAKKLKKRQYLGLNKLWTQTLSGAPQYPLKNEIVPRWNHWPKQSLL